MNNINKKLLDSSFLYLQPWFYNNKLALRCELGIGESNEYMNNAFYRAINIANILFENKKIDAAFFNRYFDNDGHAAGAVLPDLCNARRIFRCGNHDLRGE